uniref:Uncharacterized protein n=1 Tax=Tanacetum cinerariifolium TaxID=118510 RepID=A0A6L2MSV6_TANCI|nr:hypothetical protein [Tanacetum cinerariifolium]
MKMKWAMMGRNNAMACVDDGNRLAIINICESPGLLSRLEILDISGNPLTDKCAPYLSTILQKCKALYRLNIERCSISSLTVQKITESLDSESELSELFIGYNCSIEGLALVHLLDKLHTLKSFSKIQLNGIRLHKNAVDSLCKLVRVPCFSGLMIGETQIGTEAAMQLTDSWKNKRGGLDQLDMSSCLLTSNYILKLSDDISLICCIRELNLGDNPLMQEGGIALASIVKNTRCYLKVVDLSKCRLGLVGVVNILEALRVNAFIAELNLAENALESEYNASLDFVDHEIGAEKPCVSDPKGKLSSAIANAIHLRLLDVSNNGFTEEVGETLYKAWSAKSRCVVTQIDINPNCYLHRIKMSKEIIVRLVFLGNKASKNESRKSGLAAKIKNIEGNLIGKDGKPLKVYRKGEGLNTNQVNPDSTSCINHGDSIMTKVGSTTDSNSNVHMKLIHATPKTETISVVDVNTSIIKSGPNDVLGLGFNGTNQCGISVADGTNDSSFKPVTPRKVQVLVLTNDEKVLGANVTLPLVVVNEICDKFANTLYGHFIRVRLTFSIVEAYVKNAWAKYGFERAIFHNEFCPTKTKTTISNPSSSNGCGYDAGSKSKKKGANKATKRKHYQGIRFSKPKSNFIYSHVSKPNTNVDNTPNSNDNKPSCSKEGAIRAGKQSSISPTVVMNDSSCSINENDYFKDDIDLAELRDNIEMLMDDDKVLDVNTNNDMVPVNVRSTNTKSSHAELKGNDKGNSDESEAKEVCMLGVIPGGGFLDDLEDDLDCHDGYEAQLYDLTEQEQAFCDHGFVYCIIDACKCPDWTEMGDITLILCTSLFFDNGGVGMSTGYGPLVRGRSWSFKCIPSLSVVILRSNESKNESRNKSRKSGLAAKIKNIRGNLIGKDGKPLKVYRKGEGLNTNQVNPDSTSCINPRDSIVTKVGSSTNSNSNVHMKLIHATPETETIPVADVNTSTIKSGPNDALGLGFDGTNQCGISVADGTNDLSFKPVTPKKVQVLVLTNDEKVLGANVTLPLAVVNEICDKFANTLYGHFIGVCLTFSIMEAYVKNAWAKYRFERAIFHNGFFFSRLTKEWLKLVRHVSKPNTSVDNTPNPTDNKPSCSKDGAIGAGKQSSISLTVVMNDSSCSINENDYFKDDIDLAELRDNIEMLMDDDKALDVNTNNDMVHSHDASTSKLDSSMSDSDESEAKEVCMLGVIPSGGFLDDLKDDLDCYNGYEAQLYDLTEQEQAFFDQYDIRLNSRHRM